MLRKIVKKKNNNDSENYRITVYFVIFTCKNESFKNCLETIVLIQFYKMFVPARPFIYLNHFFCIETLSVLN
jgi:hypothetical protein